MKLYNKAELQKKFNLCYDSINKITNHLQLPYELKIATNYKKVPYYSQESVNKIEEFLKNKTSNDVANFFRNLARSKKGWSIPMIAKELNCDRCVIERVIKNINLHHCKGQNYYDDEEKKQIKEYLIKYPHGEIRRKPKKKITKPIKYSKRDEILTDYYKKGIELFPLSELAKILNISRKDFIKIAKDSGCEIYKIFNVMYIDLNDSENKMDLATYEMIKYNRNLGLSDNGEYIMLRKVYEILGLKHQPITYCFYLGIDIYEFKHKQSGHNAYYISLKDYDKLRNFIETYSSKERKSICTKFTNNLIYGCDNVFQNEKIKEKSRTSIIKKYGSMKNYNKELQKRIRKTLLETRRVSNVFQLDEIKEKIENTLIEKYGSLENYKKHQVDKTKATKLERYGNENYINREKMIKTSIERYGVPNAMQNEEIKNKAKKTNLLKYGYENSSSSEKVKEKIKNSWSEKSEDEIEEIMKKHHHKWTFDNLQFDSKWEIVYYFYLIDNKINFKSQIPLIYNFKNKSYFYLCDFYLIDTDEYVEIKNPQCLDENGNLKIYYKNDNQSKLDAKNKCMIDHNVKIISKKEIKFYVDYFKQNCKIPIINAKTNQVSNKIY